MRQASTKRAQALFLMVLAAGLCVATGAAAAAAPAAPRKLLQVSPDAGSDAWAARQRALLHPRTAAANTAASAKERGRAAAADAWRSAAGAAAWSLEAAPPGFSDADMGAPSGVNRAWLRTVNSWPGTTYALAARYPGDWALEHGGAPEAAAGAARWGGRYYPSASNADPVWTFR